MRLIYSFFIILMICIGGLQAQTDTTDHTKDIGWPRQVEKDGATLVYYQPQVDEWDDYKVLKARVAFSLTPADGKQVMGVTSIRSHTLVDKENRTAFLQDIIVEGVRFPSVDPADSEKLQKVFEEIMPNGGESFSVDRIMADLQQGKVQAKPVAVKNDPPVIFYSDQDAILLSIDGDPVYAPIEKTNMEYIVNTNWDVFHEKKKNEYYLLADSAWLSATELKGPWTQVKSLPREMKKLPTGENFDDVKKMVPPLGSVAAPKVFYSTSPAELILFQGQPRYTEITGTKLLYASNTDNDVFVDETKSDFYVLFSGRWFSSKSLEGPWVYSGNDLPTDFSNIPEDSPKASVLVSVPGTIQASDAVMLAQIPTTAIVNKAEVEAKVKVDYDGNPEFRPIAGTSLFYASNTQQKVIKVGKEYYLCYQAVWFESAEPKGPWKTADSVPSEIYSIPPSSPMYNVTYVTVSNPTDTTVQSNTTGGYYGMFVMGMTVGATIAYGTGYYYPPYLFWGPYPYPIYRPWPMTYGVGAVYNPWTGGFAVGRSVYGPYGAAHTAGWYNPATGRYGRSASVQGWYGGRTSASTYNPWTGTYAHTNQGHSPYAQWGNSVATRGNQWVQTGHVTTARGTAAGFRTSGGNQGVIAHGANGTVVHTDNGVFAGHDGNIYRRNENGNWSQYNRGNWNSMNNNGRSLWNPSQQHVQSGLERSQFSRQRGQFQTQRFNSFQRMGGGGIRRF
ncbi:hypothetical protein [Algoriphagus chordae]|uniref:Carbohydrate-binding family V/XII n=1 Tax=Algoriphagus chordae TaxID=237019 RepID=A0A2W7R368_9BACT|nr:hypothetical protein [Algoriphagus chordae]PZX48529.1 hypothetical protein LV85_03599 [Algoriphagus chordae]